MTRKLKKKRKEKDFTVYGNALIEKKQKFRQIALNDVYWGST